VSLPHPRELEADVRPSDEAVERFKGQTISRTDVVIRMEVWDHNIFADELLGEAELSLLPMLKYTRGGGVGSAAA